MASSSKQGDLGKACLCIPLLACWEAAKAQDGPDHITWSLPVALSEPRQVATHCAWKQELQLGSLGQDPNALRAMLPLETPGDDSILASFYLRWLATLVQDCIITE